MDTRQLKTFRIVAEQLNFTKAAEKLFLAQSSVSAQIKALERSLEIKLFDRIGRRVFLTDAGERLLGYARRVESMTEEIQAEIKGDLYLSGNLTVRVPETIATVYMPEIIDTYHKEYPDVKLTFINCSDLQLREELNSGRIDLAFLITDAINTKDINVKILKSEPLAFLSTPGHPLTNKKPVTLYDLAEHTLLFPKTD